MTSINTVVRNEILKGVGKQGEVEALQVKLDKARAGMYVHGVIAAQSAIDACDGDRVEAHKVVVTVFDTLTADFKANRRGIAERFDCVQKKDTNGNLETDEDDNPVYKIPSALSSMRYVINQGFEHGIAFVEPKRDPDGNPKFDDEGEALVKPAAFSAVRDAAKSARDKAKAEKAKATMSDDDKAKAALLEMVEGIVERINALDGAALEAAAKLLQGTASDLDKLAA